MANTKKKNNIFVSYFKPFGIKQICDILMLVSAILMLVGACVSEAVILVPIGLIIFMAVDVIMLTRHILVLVSKINRKSPEYRNAIMNTVYTGVMFLIALFGLIYFFVR